MLTVINLPLSTNKYIALANWIWQSFAVLIIVVNEIAVIRETYKDIKKFPEGAWI